MSTGFVCGIRCAIVENMVFPMHGSSSTSQKGVLGRGLGHRDRWPRVHACVPAYMFTCVICHNVRMHVHCVHECVCVCVRVFPVGCVSSQL